MSLSLTDEELHGLIAYARGKSIGLPVTDDFGAVSHGLNPWRVFRRRGARL